MSSSETETSPRSGESLSVASRPGFAVAVIVLLWLVIYVAGMFSPALLDDADSVHAEAAREMLLRHDWVTLHINGVRYLEKAPLLYWSVAASYLVFGVTEWSTRLPLVLGVLAMLLITFALGRKAYGTAGGFWSAVVLGTSLGPYLFTRFLIPDTLVGLWLALTFYFFLRSLEESSPSRFTCWGLAVASALNVLTKGLIGLVFPAAAIVLYLVLTRNLGHLLRLRLLSSFAVFLAVAAPWHILAALHNPTQGAVRGFLWFYFVNEHFLRYLNQRVPRDYGTVPLLVFWGLLLLWLLPWSAFLPQACAQIRLRWGKLESALSLAQGANLLFMLWALFILAFFSFSTRQEYYTIPALPGLALLAGGWLARESAASDGSRVRREGRISATVLLMVGAVACAVGLFFLSVSKPPAPGVELADLLKKNPEDYALSFGHFFDLTPQALGAFRTPLAEFSIAFFVGTLLNFIFRKRGAVHRGNAALALMMVVLLSSVHSAFVTFSPILSSKDLAIALQQHYQDGDVVVIDGEYEDGSTLNFYAHVPLRILHEPSANLWYGSQFPDAPHVFETAESFRTLWMGRGRVYLWTNREPAALGIANAAQVAHSGGKSLLTNHP
jgi:4-amino-4-deoxy-L-arabinose transferase-like glycosyltransferase